MSRVGAILLLSLVLRATYADGGCADGQSNPSACNDSTDGAQTVTVLPGDAAAKVKDLHAKMRFFTAIGMHRESKKRRDEIVTVYREHGVSVPEEYATEQ